MKNLTSDDRIQILSTIDELNQYLNGYVTKTSLQITLKELNKELNKK